MFWHILGDFDVLGWIKEGYGLVLLSMFTWAVLILAHVYLSIWTPFWFNSSLRFVVFAERFGMKLQMKYCVCTSHLTCDLFMLLNMVKFNCFARIYHAYFHITILFYTDHWVYPVCGFRLDLTCLVKSNVYLCRVQVQSQLNACSIWPEVKTVIYI